MTGLLGFFCSLEESTNLYLNSVYLPFFEGWNNVKYIKLQRRICGYECLKLASCYLLNDLKVLQYVESNLMGFFCDWF